MGRWEELARANNLITDEAEPEPELVVTATALIEDNSEANIISGETVLTVNISEGGAFHEDIGVEEVITTFLYDCFVMGRALSVSENADFSFTVDSFERLDDRTLVICIPESPEFSIESDLEMEIVLPKEVFIEELSGDVSAGTVTINNSSEAAVLELPILETEIITNLGRDLVDIIDTTTFITPITTLPPIIIDEIVMPGQITASLNVKNPHETAIQNGYLDITITISGGAKFMKYIDNTRFINTLCDGIKATYSKGKGLESLTVWNNIVQPDLKNAIFTRVSDDRINIRIPDHDRYNIISNETIRVSLDRDLFDLDTIPGSLGTVIAGDFVIEDCGNGQTEDTPFEIYAPGDFYHIDWENNKHFKLMNNISFNSINYPRWPVELGAGKVFDGNDKMMSNLSINRTGDNGGMFSKLSEATVKDLWIQYSSMNGEEGHNYGFIAATAEDSTITNVHLNNVNINIDGINLGGIVGTNHNSKITNCVITNSQIENSEGIYWLHPT